MLERGKDEIEWNENNASCAEVTSVDKFLLCRNGTWISWSSAMIEESLVLFPVTVLEAVIGIVAGYRLGLKENRRCITTGRGALLLRCRFRRNSPYIRNEMERI